MRVHHDNSFSTTTLRPRLHPAPSCAQHSARSGGTAGHDRPDLPPPRATLATSRNCEVPPHPFLFVRGGRWCASTRIFRASTLAIEPPQPFISSHPSGQPTPSHVTHVLGQPLPDRSPSSSSLFVAPPLPNVDSARAFRRARRPPPPPSQRTQRLSLRRSSQSPAIRHSRTHGAGVHSSHPSQQATHDHTPTSTKTTQPPHPPRCFSTPTPIVTKAHLSHASRFNPLAPEPCRYDIETSVARAIGKEENSPM